MPTVAETITIPSPPEEVWPLLSDPALVASCIPGATLAPDQAGGDVWKGQIRVKFGPTVAVFRGEATLAYDHPKMTCTIDGRGIDGRGASRALAHGVVSAKGTTETQLAVAGEYSVTGPLETFANAGGIHVARALLAEFAKNMGALVAERRSGAGTVLPEPAAAPMAATAAATATASVGSAATAVADRATAPAATTPSAPSREPIAEGERLPAYVVSLVRARDGHAFEAYRTLAAKSIDVHGGRYVVRGGAPAALEGDAPEGVVIVEFPSRVAAETWYRSAEYAEALALRDTALTRQLTLVDGLPQPPTAAAKAMPVAALPRPIAPRAAAELNAFTLLWAAFKSWLASKLGNRS